MPDPDVTPISFTNVVLSYAGKTRCAVSELPATAEAHGPVRILIGPVPATDCPGLIVLLVTATAS